MGACNNNNNNKDHGACRNIIGGELFAILPVINSSLLLNTNAIYLLPAAKPVSNRLIFFETGQKIGEHVVNFSVAQYADGREEVFKRYSTCKDFCSWIFQPKLEGYTAIADLTGSLLWNGFYNNHYSDDSKTISPPESEFPSSSNLAHLPSKDCSSLSGFKCSGPSNCNCEQLCGSTLFERVTVHNENDENIIVYDKKLTSGTYCLPKGSTRCHPRSSILIFSVAGWLCQNKPFWKGNYRIACKNIHAADNSRNVLIEDLKISIVSEEKDVDFF